MIERIAAMERNDGDSTTTTTTTKWKLKIELDGKDHFLILNNILFFFFQSLTDFNCLI